MWLVDALINSMPMDSPIASPGAMDLLTLATKLATANATLIDVFVLVYRAIGLEEQEARLAARAMRSAIHGFLALQRTRASPSDHDAEYRYLLDALQRGILNPATEAED